MWRYSCWRALSKHPAHRRSLQANQGAPDTFFALLVRLISVLENLLFWLVSGTATQHPVPVKKRQVGPGLIRAWTWRCCCSRGALQTAPSSPITKTTGKQPKMPDSYREKLWLFSAEYHSEMGTSSRKKTNSRGMVRFIVLIN